MQTLLVMPLLIPLATAALTAMVRRDHGLRAVISLIGAAMTLAAAIMLLIEAASGNIHASVMGGWPAPFGIALVIDMFSAIMLVITGVMAVAVAVFAMGAGSVERDRAGFHPLFHSLILGVCGAFLTGDIFNLYVWYEVMLIASFGLLVLDRTREQLDGGIRYVALNLIGTTLFLAAVGLLYGLTGTLNLADLALVAPTVKNQGALAAVGILLLIAFGAKAALFPVFNWLPAAYHTASMPVAAIFAALLTKVGVYSIIRVFTLVFAHDAAFFGPIVGVIAALTMITGVLGAAAHYDIRKILSFHIISQVGYMLIGVALMTPLAIAGSIFYIVHHIIVKANLFLVAGAVRAEGGAYRLSELGSLWVTRPLLGVLFLLPALSLAGIPPLSGFWGKLAIIRGGLEADAYVLVAVALGVGLLTLYSMIKIWNEAFWKNAPSNATRPRPAGFRRIAMYSPIIVLATVTLIIGLWTEPFAAASLRAATQLLNKDGYVAAVMGAARTAQLEVTE